MIVRECDKCGLKLNDPAEPELTRRHEVNINGKKFEVCKECFNGLCGWMEGKDPCEKEDDFLEWKHKEIYKEIIYIPYMPIYTNPYPYSTPYVQPHVEWGQITCGDTTCHNVAAKLNLTLGNPTLQ